MDGEWINVNLFEEITESSLSDVSGQEVFKNLFYGCAPDEEIGKWLGLKRTNCFLLSGESGAGKTFLGKAFAGEMRKYGYRFRRIFAGELLGKDREETREKIRELFAVLSSGNALFLMISELEVLDKDAASVFAAETERLKDRNFPVIILAVTENQEQIPASVQRLFFICRMTLPDPKARTEYFKLCWKDSFLLQNRETEAKLMADITDGMTYKQLDMVRLSVSGAMYQATRGMFGSVEEFRNALAAGNLKISEKSFRKIAEAVKAGSVTHRNVEEPEEKENVQKQEYDTAAFMGIMSAMLQNAATQNTLQGNFKEPYSVRNIPSVGQEEKPVEELTLEDVPDELPDL